MTKSIVITGGGSAGHVMPHLALLPRLRAVNYDITYIGTMDGIERTIIEPTGIPYHVISAGKLRRYLSWQNFLDVFRVLAGCWQSFWLLRKIRPNVVFAKGGFVSVPVVIGAWLNRIPAVIHESDITPGLANRLCVPFVRTVCYSFPETARFFPPPKGVFSGSPVRQELLTGDPAAGRKLAGFNSEKPVILVIGGSLGAKALNQIVREMLSELLADYQIFHICGKNQLDAKLDQTGYFQAEFVGAELAHVFAMASIIISRAGANSLFEYLALAKPNLLIPLTRKASRGDQILNAESFARQGYSLVLPEEELTPENLHSKISELISHCQIYVDCMKQSVQQNTIERIFEALNIVS